MCRIFQALGRLANPDIEFAWWQDMSDKYIDAEVAYSPAMSSLFSFTTFIHLTLLSYSSCLIFLWYLSLIPLVSLSGISLLTQDKDFSYSFSDSLSYLSTPTSHKDTHLFIFTLILADPYLWQVLLQLMNKGSQWQYLDMSQTEADAWHVVGSELNIALSKAVPKRQANRTEMPAVVGHSMPYGGM